MQAAVGFEADCKAEGAGQGLYGVTGPAGHPSAATGDGEQPSGHRGRATGLAGNGERVPNGERAPHGNRAADEDKAPDRLDVSPASTGAESNSADECA